MRRKWQIKAVYDGCKYRHHKNEYKNPYYEYYFRDAELHDGTKVRGVYVRIKNTQTMQRMRLIKDIEYKIGFFGFSCDEKGNIEFEYPTYIMGNGMKVEKKGNRVSKLGRPEVTEVFVPYTRKILCYKHWDRVRNTLERLNLNLYVIEWVKCLRTAVRLSRYGSDRRRERELEMTYKQKKLALGIVGGIDKHLNKVEISDSDIDLLSEHIKSLPEYEVSAQKEKTFDQIINEYRMKGLVLEKGDRFELDGNIYEVEYVFYYPHHGYNLDCSMHWRRVLKNGSLSKTLHKSNAAMWRLRGKPDYYGEDITPKEQGTTKAVRKKLEYLEWKRKYNV